MVVRLASYAATDLLAAPLGTCSNAIQTDTPATSAPGTTVSRATSSAALEEVPLPKCEEEIYMPIHTSLEFVLRIDC
ncbi:hypothetical protein BD779DRAFT_1581981 [Infundibulicybe gibba]|nr:hypothetical protein BD779DRAFT_1581981 [Infundibulicybe gibba]